MAFDELLKDRRIVICIGSGGVGKTTVAASIALRAAMEGRKTLVLTIDPARRLANSLGLSEMDNSETPIQLPAAAKGRLWGMMLDQKLAFDELVERIAPNDEVRDRILNNHYYLQISSALAGSHEYVAMEKLYEVADKGGYDLIVLDTPPTKHALDFLDAPRRMTQLLEGKVMQWFIKPYLLAGKIGFKFAQKGAFAIFKILERATGYQALADLSEFFLAFDGLYDGFKTRAAGVIKLLGDRQTAFVLVTTPQHPAVDEAAFFRDRLLESKMPVAAVVFNRVHDRLWDGPPEEAEGAADSLVQNLPAYATVIDALLELAADVNRIAIAERNVVEKYLADVGDLDLVCSIPAMPQDIHDIDGLFNLGSYL